MRRELTGFSEQQLSVPGPPSKRRQYPRMLDYRLSWALTHLRKAGAVENLRPGVWQVAAPHRPEGAA